MINTFPNVKVYDGLALAAASWLLYLVIRAARSRSRTTKLLGPPAPSWFFGVSKEVFDGDSGVLFENWAQAYGSVYQVPGPLGERRVVLTDPKAVAHYFARVDTFVKSEFEKRAIDNVIGKGVLYVGGSDHRRQRKSLNGAFTNAAIRELVTIFFESGYKAKSAWDTILASSANGEAVINVQKWMNCVSLDTIGIAGFGHDFGALRGEHGLVEEALESFGTVPPRGPMNTILQLIGPLFPALLNIPTKRQVYIKNLHSTMQGIAEGLLDKTRKDAEAASFSVSSRSIIGALVRAESADAKSTLTEEEILSQMKTLMLAGYETTSISLTWALIELSLHPEKQEKLREELLPFANGNDPSYDQLTSLPYLDAVLREILRVHPPVEMITRVTAHDDLVPLKASVKAANGETIDHVAIAANTTLIIPIRAINRSELIWGADAKEFKPERWLSNEAGLTTKSKEISGFHHLLSFIDGPRICLGRLFAVAEFKAVLSVLIRNYAFEMRDGPGTKVEEQTTLLPRPKVTGEEGYAMPMRVRRVGQ